MFTRRLRRQFTVWLAAMAVLLAGLLPVMSHAFVSAPSNGQGWVEVCTVSGMAWVKQTYGDIATGTSHTNPAPAQGGFADPCKWCATHSPLLGLPSLTPPLVAPPMFGTEAQLAFLSAPRPLFAWASAHSRAPPAST